MFANMMHFLCSENINQAKYLIRSPIFGNFIFRNTGLLSEDAEYYGRIVRSTLIQKDHLRLVHLMNTGTKIQTIKIAQSDQKNKAVDAVKIFLVAAQFQTRVATIISAAVDELLLNAIFDAPTDTEGRPLHLRTNRSATLELDGKKSIEMHIGFDGLYVGVSIVDYFGSLDKENLLSHISKIYVAEEYKVQESVAGAGIGLATVFQSGGSLLFSVQPGVRTEVSVFFKKRNNFREFKKQFQFIAIQFY